MRATSQIAPGRWDYTTLDRELLDEAARLTVKDLEQLGSAEPPRRSGSVLRKCISDLI